MKRILSCLVLAGFLTVPAVASAEPQYVYVRYGNGAPYLYVTTTPRPFYPYQRTWVERSDGVRFDSEVGAACGTLHTDIFFSPSGTTLTASDHSQLGYIGHCLTRGPLAGVRVNLVAGYDGTLASMQRAQSRLGSVIGYLQALGVPPSQMSYSKELVPGWQSDRIMFRFAEPSPWPYVIRKY